mgnify:CR=1 FL=1
MEDSNKYFQIFKELITKINNEKLIVCRLKDNGLYGESYLFLIKENKISAPPNLGASIKGYVSYKYLEGIYTFDEFDKQLSKGFLTIELFEEPLHREDLNLGNLEILLKEGFVQVRTNKVGSPKRK